MSFLQAILAWLGANPIVPGVVIFGWISVFHQSFFLHRYSAHKMYTMSPFVERLVHFSTWFWMGSSYLMPRGYAILHREHHAFSDTEKDPHSPHHVPDLFTMMWNTKKRYGQICRGTAEVQPRFLGDYPEWELIDKIGNNRFLRVVWGAGYTVLFYFFVTAWWQWLLLPIVFVMGPVHGAIVNWCGHMYGYRNFDIHDQSRNTLPFDVVTGGELFQNNHHKYSRSANFAQRWFEIDPTFAVMRILDWLHIIKLLRPKTTADLI